MARCISLHRCLQRHCSNRCRLPQLRRRPSADLGVARVLAKGARLDRIFQNRLLLTTAPQYSILSVIHRTSTDVPTAAVNTRLPAPQWHPPGSGCSGSHSPRWRCPASSPTPRSPAAACSAPPPARPSSSGRGHLSRGGCVRPLGRAWRHFLALRSGLPNLNNSGTSLTVKHSV